MLDYNDMRRYLLWMKSDHSIDDFRMGLIKEAVVTDEKTINTYGQTVIQNLDKDPLYYYTFIDKLRKPKFLGMAIFDVAATIIGILFLTAIIGSQFQVVGVVVFALAVFTHWYFGIETQLGYYLGLNQQMRPML